MASILCCCANGSGTSLMMAMTLEKVIKQQGYSKVSKTHHCSLSEGKNTSMSYDIVLCPQNFTNMFKAAEAKGVKVIGMKNVMSPKEMTEKLENCGVELK
ncbi:MAG: PTS sugar transporter subunit IIB [Lachnospiraceae bacterium]|nr:PTS sugar transporter subunit IIB [Lachnospiraceae bacterium]